MASELELEEAEGYIKSMEGAIDAHLETILILKTKLAMRDQQLREADAEVARLKADKAPVDTTPEPWEAIVTAALRWRDGADRGELASAVDAFRGQPGAMVSDLKGLAARESTAYDNFFTEDPTLWLDPASAYVCRQCLGPMKVLGINTAEHVGAVCSMGAKLARGYVRKVELRPEQYADGAGAQAWRQAMAWKL